MNAHEPTQPTETPETSLDAGDPAERPTHRPGWGLGDNPPPGFLRPASAVVVNPRAARIRYCSHRGETRWRRIIPRGIHFGRSHWHPENQWLLEAFDLDKAAYRTFSVSQIIGWEATTSLQRPSDAEVEAAKAESRRCWDEGELAAQPDKPDPCPIAGASAELRRLWKEGKLGPQAEDKARCSQAIPSTESPSQTIFEDVGGFVAHSVNGEAFLVFADGAVKLSSVVHIHRVARLSAPGDYIEVDLGNDKLVRFEPWPREEPRLPASRPDPVEPRPREMIPPTDFRRKEIAIGDRVHLGAGPVMRVGNIEIGREGEILVGCLYPREDGTEVLRWFLPKGLTKLQAEASDAPVMFDNKGNKIVIGDHVQLTMGGPVMRIEGAQVDDRKQLLVVIRHAAKDGPPQWVWASPRALVKSDPDAPTLSVKVSP